MRVLSPTPKMRLKNIQPTSVKAMKLSVVVGDITTMKVDAVVNAANSTLLGGGGVDGAIHRAAGPQLLAACQTIRRTTLKEGLPAGEAIATTAGDLPAKWVIHTVGPVYSISEDLSHVLASAYTQSLYTARYLGARTVAFPAISTGAYSWPLADAARIAVEAVHSLAGELGTDIDEVIFVAFDARAETAFQEALRNRGPLTR